MAPPPVNVDVFVNIHRHQPVSRCNEVFLFCRTERRVLGHGTHLAEWVVPAFHDPGVGQKIQDTVRAIGAVVGVDQKPVDPYRPIVGQPVNYVRAFIFHRGDDGDASFVNTR